MSQENSKIEVIDEIERFMQLHNLPTIQSLVDIKTEDLFKMDGFGYRLLSYIFCEKKLINNSRLTFEK